MEIKIGLEVHQQLETHKLFCNCPSKLKKLKSEDKILRKLNLTESELGGRDIAASAEISKNLEYIYEFNSFNTCLVELDEEPPSLNSEALWIAETIAQMFDCEPIPQIHFMRKIVVDGSNTSGFQRTALIARDGEVNGIGIQTVCLEEDAARKVRAEEKQIIYNLDRLGIPLIEIATAPEIKTGKEAHEIARRIGQILRASRMVKRGLGTIRQDLNVSIEGGPKIELKGVQNLRDIESILDKEVERQRLLMESARLGFKFKFKVGELTCISNLLGREARGFKIHGAKGLFKKFNIGKFCAEYVRVYSRAKGIIHSDELPDYGIDEDKMTEISGYLNCEADDLFVIILGSEGEKVFELVRKRLGHLSNGVPGEVRRIKVDLESEYMRPMPGSSRMYPETDIPAIRITEKDIEELRVPDLPEKTIQKLQKFGLNMVQIDSLISNGDEFLFEELSNRYGEPRIIGRILLNIIPELEKEGLEREQILGLIPEMMNGYKNKEFAKEAISGVLKERAEGKRVDIDTIGIEDARKIITQLIDKKADFIRAKSKRERAIPGLMGIAMKELKGKIDGSTIHKLVEEELDIFIKSSNFRRIERE